MGDRETYVDGDRVVDFNDDDGLTLSEATRDDTDEGWVERPRRDDNWLREQRPPHWD